VKSANDSANLAYLVQKFTPDPLKKLPVNEPESRADSKGVDAVGNFDWLTIIDRLGLPVVALIAIGYGLHNSARWLGNNILMPIHQRHLIFLDRLEAGISRIVDTQHDQSSQIIHLTQKISDHLEAQEKKN
jgi:hypothetical protein